MKIDKFVMFTLFIALMSNSVYAAECEPNDSGGSFCVHADGTMSNSFMNEEGGQETFSSNGRWTSSFQDGAGTEYTMSNDGITAQPSPEPELNDTHPPSVDPLDDASDSKDNALLGSHWSSPTEYNSNGAATSSISQDDSTSDKWP